MSRIAELLSNSAPTDQAGQARRSIPWRRIIGFLGRWLVVSVVTTVGATVSYPPTMMYIIAIVTFDARGPEAFPIWGWALLFGSLAALPLLVGSVVMGVGQVWAADRLLPSPARWLWATVAGAGAAGLLLVGPLMAAVLMLAVSRRGVMLEAPGDLALMLLGIGTGAGITQGVAQGLALRRQVMGWSWWMVASSVAAIAAWLGIAGAAWQLTRLEFYRAELLVSAAGGAVYGLITGAVLLWLLRERLMASGGTAAGGGR